MPDLLFLSTQELAERWQVDRESHIDSWYRMLRQWRDQRRLLPVDHWRYEVGERPLIQGEGNREEGGRRIATAAIQGPKSKIRCEGAGVQRVYLEFRVISLVWASYGGFAERVKLCNMEQIRQLVSDRGGK